MSLLIAACPSCNCMLPDTRHDKVALSYVQRDVLKNVAYSVKMGMQLSHAGSKSLRYYYDAQGKVRFPDENYAR